MMRIEPGASYVSAVLPAVLVFASGLALTVAPLTATVLAAADAQHAGIASGVNNAVARVGGLLAVAAVPLVAGFDPTWRDHAERAGRRLPHRPDGGGGAGRVRRPDRVDRHPLERCWPRRHPATRRRSRTASRASTAERMLRRSSCTAAECARMAACAIGDWDVPRLQVSELCLGTMNFGPQTPEPDSRAIMDRALELGINFFDTANRYGGDKGLGRDRGDRRPLVRARRRSAGQGGAGHQALRSDVGVAQRRSAVSARHIRAACDASLRRLQTDHIDLYQMHHIDRTAPWDEVWQAMDIARPAGQDHLRRQQQLRRLAHRAGQRRAAARRLARPRQRAEPLQPARPHGRARGAARLPRVRRRGHPVEPAVGWPARRRARQRDHRAATVGAGAAAHREAAPAAREVGVAVRRDRRAAGRRRARVAAASGRRDVSDHRTAHDGPARRCVACVPSTCRSTPTRCAEIDAIFPGPGGTAPEAYAW